MRIVLILMCLFVVFNVFADDFADYKDINMKGFKAASDEFSSYKDSETKNFETYKEIMDKEFSAYKAEIAKVWDDVEFSDNYKWVEYINNYKIRKIVDFEKGEIHIDVAAGDYRPDFAPVLKDVIMEDSATAFYRDPVSVNTEKKIREAVKGVVVDKVKAVPVVSRFYSDKPLSEKQADDLAGKLAAAASYSEKKSGKTGGKVYSLTVKLPEDSYKKAAADVFPHVKDYSGRFGLDQALVMAVIYTESRFNPLAKSYVPAYGLMQIVPGSAGADATEYIEGQKRILAPSYLFNPENNIKIGTAYFYLLYNKYLKGVKNETSRLYCAIAAYNTGVGNIAYAYNKNTTRSKYSIGAALNSINAMSPDEVFNYLKQNLRFEEARNYLVRVTGKIDDYRK